MTPADKITICFDGRIAPHQQQTAIETCSDLLHSGGYITPMALGRRHYPTGARQRYYRNWMFSVDYSVRFLWQLADKEGFQGSFRD